MRGFLFVFGAGWVFTFGSAAKAMTKGGLELRVDKLPNYTGPLMVKTGFNALANTALSSADKCNATLEMAFAFDVTESFADDVPMLQQQVPLVLSMVKERFSGSRIAVTTFRDKPIVPLGYNTSSWSDDCMEHVFGFDDTTAVMEKHLEKLYTAGGYDYKEAQLEALMRLALSEHIGWTDPSVEKDPVTGLPIIRLAVLATDCTWHEAGDAAEAAELHNASVQVHALDKDPSVLRADVNAQCGSHDYPEYATLSEVYAARKLFPVFLAQPCGYMRDGEVVVFPDFQDAAEATGNEDYLDPSKGMLLMYTQLLEKLNLHGVVSSLEADASDLYEALDRFLEVLPEMLCDSIPPTTTTTATPTVSATGDDTTVSVPISVPSSTADKAVTTPAKTLPTATEEASKPECECVCEKDPCGCPCNNEIVISINLDVAV